MPVYRASTQFGDDGAVTGDNIRFTINGMDAIATGNTIYPVDYTMIEVCLEVRGEIIKECILAEGWNLVSWNVNTDTDGILDVLGPYMNCIDVILGFERGGLTFDPDLQQFSTLWSVDHLSGYWVKVKPGCPVTLAITGLPVPVTAPISVYQGWNLVSYLPEGALTPDIALQSLTGNLLYAYGWDGQILIYQPGAIGFNTLDTLSTCNGYWLKLGADGVLEYPMGTMAAPLAGLMKRGIEAVSSSGQSGAIVTPTWVNAYASNLTVNGNTVSSGSRVSAHAVNTNDIVGSFVINESGKFGFMPVYAGEESPLKQGDQFYLAIDGVETKERFEWTNNGDRLEVTALSSAGSSGGTLPFDYSLGQNYPNPFNPSTSITKPPTPAI